jgi:Methyltransferase domain
MMKAPRRIGVDPKFQFTRKMRMQRLFGIQKMETFETTSNDFFDKNASNILSQGIDVAFVDGLHTHAQSFKDVEDCLQYLNEGGVIVMHDCNPLSAATAYPAVDSHDEVVELAEKGEIPGWNCCWNGDVWKAFVKIRLTHPELYAFTLDLDWGLGIITKKSNTALLPASIKGYSVREIEEADFSFFERNRQDLLNLQPPKFLNDFLKSLKSDVSKKALAM